MQRFCTAHTHRGSSRAFRLILARHSLDSDAHRRVVDEHGGCPQCWADTALAAVEAAELLLIRSAARLPEMDDHGNVGGASIDWLLAAVDSHLAAEQADRRDLDSPGDRQPG